MKKFLVLVVVLCLILGITMVARADAGFYCGFGYEGVSNELSVTIPDFVTVGINTPGKVATAQLGFGFTDNIAIEGKYSMGVTNLANLNFYPYPFEAKLNQDIDILQIEGVIKVPVSSKVNLGGVLGYLDNKTSTNLWVEGWEGSLQQNIAGVYAGVLLSVNPCEQVELGGSYRYLFDRNGKITIAEEGDEVARCDLENIQHTELEVFIRAAISENWKLKAAYSDAYTKYDLCSGECEVACHSGAVKFMVEHQF